MKITETTERECCQTGDMKSYQGDIANDGLKRKYLMFCQYCGQLWYETSLAYAAGGRESVRVKIPLGHKEGISS